MRGASGRSGAQLLLMLLVAPAFVAALPSAESESVTAAGSMTINSSADRIGFMGTDVPGKISWKITGDQASRFRELIIDKYDKNIGVLNGTGNADDTLDLKELERYEKALECYLENVGLNVISCTDSAAEGHIFYFGVRLASVSLRDHVSGGALGAAIDLNMIGLPGRNRGSSEDIEIMFKFDGTAQNESDQIVADTVQLANALYAPLLDGGGRARFTGQLEVHHSMIIIGYQSYQEFEMRHGSVFMIRTPVGVWVKYDAVFSTTDAGKDRISYSSFNGLENAQVLFVALIVAGHFTINLPHTIYVRMRNKIPVSRRSAVKRISWVHWLAAVFLLVQILLYFFPTVGPLFIGGLGYWALALSLLFVSAFLSWYIYFKKELPRIEAMKEQPKPEPTKSASKSGTPAVQVTVTNAPTATVPAGPAGETKAATSTMPGAKPELAIPGVAAVVPSAAPTGSQLLKGQCAHCGAKITYEKGPEELVTCGNCSIPILKINPGYGYLIVDDDSRTSYLIFSSLARFGMKACFATATMPQKVMREYKFEGPEAIWLTDSGTAPNAINPLRLEFEITRNITRFAKMNAGGVVLVEGVNYLVLMNGYEKVYKFLKKLIDLTSMSDIVLMVAISKRTVSEEQYDILRREFDKVVEASRMEKAKVESLLKPGEKTPQASVVRASPPVTPAQAAPTPAAAESPAAAHQDASTGPRPTSVPAAPASSKTSEPSSAPAAPASAPAPARPRELPKKRTATLGTADVAEPCATCKETIAKDDWLIACQCGFKFHTACANKAERCVNCDLSLKPQA